MLALVGYIGGAWRGLVDLARRNPALKWALIALGVVFAVEVVAELGLKVYREAVAAYVEGSTAQDRADKAHLEGHIGTQLRKTEEKRAALDAAAAEWEKTETPEQKATKEIQGKEACEKQKARFGFYPAYCEPHNSTTENKLTENNPCILSPKTRAAYVKARQSEEPNYLPPNCP